MRKESVNIRRYCLLIWLSLLILPRDTATAGFAVQSRKLESKSAWHP